MDSESGGFSRCARHPSQILTGICSFCLAERLSSVESSERSPRLPCGLQSEIEEIAAPELEKKPGGGRVRKTLLSLFELDDRNDFEGKEEAGCGCESGAAHDFSCSISVQVLESGIRAETSVSGSNKAGGDSCSNDNVAKKLDPHEDEDLKGANASFSLGSVFSKRSLRWRTRNPSSKKSQKPEQSSGVRIRENGDRQPEIRPNYRHSCEWSLCRDPGRASWEVPRHSWDGGSMVSKAFACSFACLEERQDASCRIKRRLPDEATTTDPVSFTDKMDVGKIGKTTTAPEAQQDASTLGISSKKSHRWSRVWDWSITSPFRDLVKKRGHVLERSMSESWREGWRDKSMETAEPDGRSQFYGNGHGSARANQSLNKSVTAVNGDLHNFRLDQQKKKECKFGRSRSVHYSSPGNLDNGLLRFYLTPLRSSRRPVGNGRRRRTSRSLARGILGLH